METVETQTSGLSKTPPVQAICKAMNRDLSPFSGWYVIVSFFIAFYFFSKVYKQNNTCCGATDWTIFGMVVSGATFIAVLGWFLFSRWRRWKRLERRVISSDIPVRYRFSKDRLDVQSDVGDINYVWAVFVGVLEIPEGLVLRLGPAHFVFLSNDVLPDGQSKSEFRSMVEGWIEQSRASFGAP